MRGRCSQKEDPPSCSLGRRPTWSRQFGVNYTNTKVGECQVPATRLYRMVARAEAAEATRLRILDAARQLFADLLYDQVSLNAVAARAGVTVQTVIRRFTSKE